MQATSLPNDTSIITCEEKVTAESKSTAALIDVYIDNGLNHAKLSKEERANIVTEKRSDIEGFIKSLDTSEVLKTMLATQMLEVYEHQQRVSAQARLSTNPQQQQYYLNNLTKLSNVFIQQIGLMQKLTGQGQQKVTVEHVHIHNGGQAVIGKIETTSNGGGTDE